LIGAVGWLAIMGSSVEFWSKGLVPVAWGVKSDEEEEQPWVKLMLRKVVKIVSEKVR
jgi:hypothetical protein